MNDRAQYSLLPLQKSTMYYSTYGRSPEESVVAVVKTSKHGITSAKHGIDDNEALAQIPSSVF